MHDAYICSVRGTGIDSLAHLDLRYDSPVTDKPRAYVELYFEGMFCLFCHDCPLDCVHNIVVMQRLQQIMLNEYLSLCSMMLV